RWWWWTFNNFVYSIQNQLGLQCILKFKKISFYNNKERNIFGPLNTVSFQKTYIPVPRISNALVSMLLVFLLVKLLLRMDLNLNRWLYQLDTNPINTNETLK